ncbi:uncharacterized protein RJT21DRAFT_139465 [Scheffersomyces amazonensis]|uniref:uncharacterized protein n=1 Tax=Scheffersomyces amazonensis TaxID=1078765 RepID=UPI00315DC291
MSSVRPKRKATINKSYNDTLEEFQFEDVNSKVSTNDINNRRASPKKPITNSESKSNGNTNTKIIKEVASIPFNLQRSPIDSDYFSIKLNLTDAYINLKTQTLYCPNHYQIDSSKRKNGKNKEEFSLKKGDYIYMVSEPPGEPYYIGRIIGFKAKTSNVKIDDSVVDAKGYTFQVQWFYRPRDISKSTSDSRVLFASMHTDTCPLASFRGLVTVMHKHDIEDRFLQESTDNSKSKKHLNQKKSASPGNSSTAIDLYIQKPNHFYFEKLFDRYMIKFYDILSTSNLLQYASDDNVTSKNFLIALNKRFEFVFVESQRTKSFINTFSSSACNCEKCGQWCGISQDSINCAVCDKFYHMYCLDPPLLKKPSRGFSWSCAVCTKKQEIEYHKRKMLMLSHDNKSSNEFQLHEELSVLNSLIDSQAESDDTASLEIEPDDDGSETPVETLPKYESMAIDFLEKDSNYTLEERRINEEWPMRYLGMHARLEDAVDPEDRSPYPRAATRMGAKHQATNIPEYEDHPIVYYDIDKPTSATKKKSNGLPKSKSSKSHNLVDDERKLEIPEQFKNMSKKEFPQWLQPRPKGYIERGVDDGEGITCTSLWKASSFDEEDDFHTLDEFIKRCSPLAAKLDLLDTSPNFMDAVVYNYMTCKGDLDSAYENITKLTRKSLKEPTFNKEEIKRFESGVREFGSELYPVFKRVKTQPSAMVVRFYYLWKKTKNGRLIWGNYEGRMQKKLQNIVKDETSKQGAVEKPDHIVIDSLADPEDDSSYDNVKAETNKRQFSCKHCHTNRSLQWFRITGHDADKPEKDIEGVTPLPEGTVTALCFRCAKLWRRYAVTWEDPNEIERINKQPGWKKRVEPELLEDVKYILNEADRLGATISYDIDMIKSLPSKSVKVKENSAPVVDIPIKKATKEIRKEVSVEPKKKKIVNKSTQKENVKTKKVANVKVEDKTNSKSVKAKKVKASVSAKEVKPKATKRKLESDLPELESNDPSKIQPVALKKPKRANDVTYPSFSENYSSSNIKGTERIKDLSKDMLQNIVEQFRRRQLTNLESQIASMHVPSSTSVSVPFSPNERKCCICREHDINTKSGLEMLICSSCGVNIHASCAGIQVGEKTPRPVKEWLCEVCINDVQPHNSTIYSCSLCFANEANYELAFLGSTLVRPDFLKPIYDSNKWCHVLCAIFNHEHVTLRGHQPIQHSLNRQSPPNDSYITDNGIAFESVSDIFVRPNNPSCGICSARNGSMICCEICGPSDKYHVTCAQDTPNFKLGFSLDHRSVKEKDSYLVSVNGSYGILHPILICPKHDQTSSTVFGMRTLGKRVHGTSKDEGKPLIQLYLEDITRQNYLLKPGPQSKSKFYIERFKASVEDSQEGFSWKADPESPIKAKKNCIHCIECSTTTSPIWWEHFATNSTITTTTNGTRGYLCQICYHNSLDKEEKNEIEIDTETETGTETKVVSEEEDTETFVQALNAPLIGSHYGIQDQTDNVRSIFVPTLRAVKANYANLGRLATRS